MKRLFPIILLLYVFVHFSSCEKDDICVEGDTPLLVIGFFDFADTTLEKNATTLRIRELNSEEPIDGNLEPEDKDIKMHFDRSTTDSTGIPIRISESTTAFQFILNSSDGESEDGESTIETGNIDTLSFNYMVRENFISRACGFVANFDDLSADLSFDSENWIQDIKVVDTTIENSTAIHVKIFH
ncbi:MAG: DUF6452 family protein [Bacteroidota bacterium]